MVSEKVGIQKDDGTADQVQERGGSPTVADKLKVPGVLLAVVLAGVILVIGIIELKERLHWWGYESMVFVFVIALPTLLGRAFRLVFPWAMTTLIASSLFLHCVGNYGGYYWSHYPYYDKFVHLIAGIMISSVALVGIGLFERQRYEALKPEGWNVPIVVIMAAVIMGFFWELAEYAFDVTLGTVLFTLMHGWADTAMDMVMDGVGGVTVAVYSVHYLRTHENRDLVKDRPE